MLSKNPMTMIWSLKLSCHEKLRCGVTTQTAATRAMRETMTENIEGIHQWFVSRSPQRGSRVGGGFAIGRIGGIGGARTQAVTRRGPEEREIRHDRRTRPSTTSSPESTRLNLTRLDSRKNIEKETRSDAPCWSHLSSERAGYLLRSYLIILSPPKPTPQPPSRAGGRH
jgi:hypothetical protein